MKADVKIYEYRNGFIHANIFASDDFIATEGKTNLDFRSLYLHFECGTVVYGTKAVIEVKEDFLNTFNICQPITEKEVKRICLAIFQDVQRMFDPLVLSLFL